MTAFLYIAMLGSLFFLFDRNQSADDILNASRPNADYVHAFSYGFNPFDIAEFRRAAGYYKTLQLGNFKTGMMHGNLGFCYYYLKDLPRAVKEYEKGIEIDQSLYTLYYDLAWIKMQQGDYAGAEELFRKSKFLMPKNLDDLLGKLHVGQRHAGHEVFPHYMQERVPRDRLMVNANLCFIYLQTKQYQNLLSMAGEGIAAHPQDPQFYFYAGVASFHLGFLKESLVFLTKALDLAPNYAEAYEYRAQLMHVLGEGQGYLNDLEKSKLAKSHVPWQRPRDIEELHHWDDGILLFQIYP